MAANDIVRFKVGNESNLSSEPKEAGKVLFAIDSDKGYIYYDKDNSTRIQMAQYADGWRTGRVFSYTGDTTGTIGGVDGTGNVSVTLTTNAISPTELTNQDLNNYKTVQKTKFYYAAGGNTVAHSPKANTQFGAYTYASAAGHVAMESSFYADNTIDNHGKFIRWHNGNSWSEWEKFLTDKNYTNWTVTKTGSGASGTWDINITGNAATATVWESGRVFKIQDNSATNTGPSVTVDGSSNITLKLPESIKVKDLLATNNITVNTGDIDIVNILETNKFLGFYYDTSKTAGASWRLGYLGTGSGDTNYFVIQSGTSTTTATTWNDVIRLEMNSFKASFLGNVNPRTDNTKTLGEENLRWATVYAVRYHGIVDYADAWANGRVFTISDNSQTNTGPGTTVDGSANVNIKLPNTIKAATFQGGTYQGTSAKASYMGIDNTDGTKGYGLSLYGGYTTTMPTYGIAFAGTSTFGMHARITDDSATYLTMNDNTERGWIFKRGTTNVASISGRGEFTGKFTAANYNTQGNNNGKYYKISILSEASWMLLFRVRLYHSYKHMDIDISGYNYGANHWHRPYAVMASSSVKDRVTVSFGYTTDWKLWIAIPAGQYTGLDIINVTNGYTQVDNYSGLFKIEIVDAIPATLQTSVDVQRPWYGVDEEIELHHLILSGTTDDTMTAASTNPRITFQEGANATKPVHLIYTDYGTYRSPAGLKVIGGTNATPAWFEVEGDIIGDRNLSLAGNATVTGTITSNSTGNAIMTPNGDIWAGTYIANTAQSAVYRIGAQSGAGKTYLYSGAAITDYHGLYLTNAAGSSGPGITFDQGNRVATMAPANFTWAAADSGTGNLGSAGTPWGTIYLNNWIRTTGKTGWYSQTYGGGWYMEDNDWIRNYGSKGVAVNNHIFVNQTDGIGKGIGLYGTALKYGHPEYGLSFAKTSTTNFSTFGDVTSDWATYFHMSPSSNEHRGWIFQRDNVNVFSISSRGHVTATLTPSTQIAGHNDSHNAAYEIADYSNKDSYNPWMRATNTWASGNSDAKVGRFFGFGTLGDAFFWGGSPSTRVDNGFQNSMNYDTNTGTLWVGNITAPNISATTRMSAGGGLDTNYIFVSHGKSWVKGPLYIGMGDVQATTGYKTDNVGWNNYIAFYGVYGDGPGAFNHTYIGERVYGPKDTANEKSELLLYHGNDPAITDTVGSDRIRLFAGQIKFDVYTANTSGTWDAIGTSANAIEAMTIHGTNGIILGNATARSMGVNQITVNGHMVINGAKNTSNSYSEGLRINKSSNGWALITLGGEDGSQSGISDNIWLIGASSKNLYIRRNGSSGTTAPGINGGDNGFSVHNRLYINQECNTDFNFSSNGPSEIYNGILYIDRDATNTQITGNQDAGTAQIQFRVKATEQSNTRGYSVIQAFQSSTATTYNQSLVMYATGGMYIGGGESALTIHNSGTEGSSGSEDLYLCADGSIRFYPGADGKVHYYTASTSAFYPVKNNSYALGTSDLRWSYLYTQNTRVTGTIYFGENTSSGKAILAFNTTYPNYGMWYFDEAVDKLTIDASGTGNSQPSADFGINVHGAGTLTNRNRRIPHTGNTTGTVGSATLPVYVNAGQITAITSLNDALNKTNFSTENIFAGFANYNSGTFTYDEATKTYTITSAVISSTWGSGVQLIGSTTGGVHVPYGYSYRFQAEVYVPSAHTIAVDYNNYATSGTSWSGNDNDGGGPGRVSTGLANIPANTWTKITFGCTNLNSNNTNKVPIYIVDGIGLVTSADSASVTWKMKNVKVQIGEVVTTWTPTNSYVSKGSAYQPVYVNSQGVLEQTSYKLYATVNTGAASAVAYYSDAYNISYANNARYQANVLLSSSRNNTTVDIRRNGLHICGTTYGNTAAEMLSNTEGVFRFNDGGPQITFDTSTTPGGGQAGALIFTDHDSAGTGTSFHFVSNQNSNNYGGDATVTAPRFRARRCLTVNSNSDLATDTYRLYVNGGSYFTNTITGDIVSAWHLLAGRPSNTTNFNTYFETIANVHHDDPARTDTEISYNRWFASNSDQTNYSPSKLNLPVVDQHVLSFGIDNGVTYSRHLAFDIRTNNVFVRARNNNTWTSWQALALSNNATSFTLNQGTSPYVAYYSANGGISSAQSATNMIMPSHYYHTMYSNATTGTEVYQHFYNTSVTATNTNANLRVKNGSTYSTFRICGASEVTWDGTQIRTTNGYLAATKNSNTVTIGSQNANFCHIYNSANIPFIFNNHVKTTTGNLGGTDYPWNNLYMGKGDGAGIYYTGSKNTYRMIRFIDNANDVYGNGISIGGGGQTIIGGGESADAMCAQTANNGAEIMWIGNDGAIDFYPEIQNGYSASNLVRITASRIWAGVNGDTTREAQVGVQSGAGQLYMWSHASTTGDRGIYTPAHGSGSAKAIFLVNTNNVVTFNGKVIDTADGVSYIAGAKGDNATVYAKKGTGSVWRPAVALQTSSGGSWQIGNYNDDTLEFQFATKANIDSQTNTTSEIYMQNGDTGRVMTTGNYTNWTVSKTGTGASGTWGISISGNAATATTATTATKANGIAYQTQISNAAALDSFTADSTMQVAKVSSISGLSGVYSSGNDGMILSIPWSASSYGKQIFFDDSSNKIYHRYRSSSTWQSWVGIPWYDTETLGAAGKPIWLNGGKLQACTELVLPTSSSSTNGAIWLT